MSDESSRITSADLSDALEDLVDRARAPIPEPPFRTMLTKHFGIDPTGLATVAHTFEPMEHANLQLALESYLDADERSVEVVGVAAPHKRFMRMGLSELIASRGGDESAVVGPVEYQDVELGDGSVLTCVRDGLFLVREDDHRIAARISMHEQGSWRTLEVEAMALERAGAEQFLAGLRKSMKEKSVYRGATIALSVERYDEVEVALRSLPEIPRDRVILPAGVLERIERQTIGFSNHGEKLLAAGRHLRRGLLLHGPPGTGKTLTAMYLAAGLSERTTLLVTGQSQALIKKACTMARALQPSMVVVEDVDLVAEERTSPAACTVLLFELLNEMDGLAEDADVVFLLTTNRPDLLEPALASRPGRIDQAIEIPLPDERSRRQLLELYAEGLEVVPESLEPYVSRTEGASGAFIKELLRKAALFAADEGDSNSLVVQDRHLDEALHELLVEGGILTKKLLGAETSTP